MDVQAAAPRPCDTRVTEVSVCRGSPAWVTGRVALQDHCHIEQDSHSVAPHIARNPLKQEQWLGAVTARHSGSRRAPPQGAPVAGSPRRCMRWRKGRHRREQRRLPPLPVIMQWWWGPQPGPPKPAYHLWGVRDSGVKDPPLWQADTAVGLLNRGLATPAGLRPPTGVLAWLCT